MNSSEVFKGVKRSRSIHCSLTRYTGYWNLPPVPGSTTPSRFSAKEWAFPNADTPAILHCFNPIPKLGLTHRVFSVTGARCGSPALKGEQFCYFHQNAIRSVRRPKQSRLHPIALIEDEESIQYALVEVINALMKNTIDLKRATLILRALHIAVKNASRVKFEVQGMNSVRHIPEYAPPPDNTDPSETTEIDLPYNAWVPQKSERQIMEEKHSARKLQEWKDQQAAIRANLERARITPRKEESTHGPKQSTPNAADATTTHMGTTSVGADAFVRPANKASVPAAEASTSPQAAPPATAVPPHNFKPQQTSPEPPMTANQSPGTQRKPPQPATAAPNGRKNAAHACPQQSRRAAKHA